MVMTLYLLWLQEKSKQKAEATAEWIGRCKRVRLTETREELLQKMGPPGKEAVVADGRTVLIFPHWAVSDKFPRFYLDPRRGRIDHIVCTEKQTVRMTPQLWAEWDRYQAYLLMKERYEQSRAIIGDSPSP